MITTKSFSPGIKPQKIEKTSLLVETLQRMVKSPGAKIGTILFALIVIACVSAPLIAPYEFNEMDLKHMYEMPSSIHLLGTDGLGPRFTIPPALWRSLLPGVGSFRCAVWSICRCCHWKYRRLCRGQY